MARTPLFDSLRRAMRLAKGANRAGAPPIDELIELRDEAARIAWSRRQFLKAGAISGLGLAGGSALSGCATVKDRWQGYPPRVVIVGAGLAGLTAAYHLKQMGIDATVYEGSLRVGGRVRTGHNIMAPGLVTELGGEFIDSNHADMISLAREFRLELMDTRTDGAANLIREAYFFDGRHHTEREVIEAFVPLAPRIESDLAGIGNVVDYRNVGGAEALDRTSLSDYFAQIGAGGLIRELLEVAYVSEFGLDAAEQSALNLLYLISTNTGDGFHAYGESDERYKIRGGNEQITEALARSLGDHQFELGCRLAAIQPDIVAGGGYTLAFDRAQGAAKEAKADAVILAIPFTMLRDVSVRVELPSVKQQAIKELGYGANAKLLLACGRRTWREKGYAGNIVTDEGFQCAWDSSRMQPGRAGSLTVFAGGQTGLAMGKETPLAQAERYLPGLERAFANVKGSFTGKAERFHWPSFPWTLGSYSCYKPGQWTAFAGAEREPVGAVFFAGEHCSANFQGFMNGAVESGRVAAEALLRKMNWRQQRRILPRYAT